MSEAVISPKAYIKMIFHAGEVVLFMFATSPQCNNDFPFSAKYPHLAVNGLLLGKKSNDKARAEVLDAVPLFHQCLFVTPMSEIALVQVESRASREGLQIIGYYAAAENFYDNSLDKLPGIKIAEKIAEQNGSACVVMVSLGFVSCDFTTKYFTSDG